MNQMNARIDELQESICTGPYQDNNLSYLN